MLNSNVVNSRISKLREYIKILKDLANESKENFISNYKIYGLAERYLQLAIECILDIGNHIISRLELKKPETYQDILLILGENSILPKYFAEKVAKMAGFRNILVHGYTDIDETIVYEQTHDGIQDFEEFIKYILKFLNVSKN
ncbi:MAG: type VII toxin-antitoxin system HepT family RNase toxin [Candidatus Helarchaeota archaeon]